MESIPKYLTYYLLSLGLLVLGTILTLSFSPVYSFIGIILFVGGCYLCFFIMRVVQGKSARSQSKPKKIKTKKRVINTNGGSYVNTAGGTYNEKVYGNSINLQNCKIYLKQDLSQLTKSIEKVLDQLQKQGFSQLDSEHQIIDELKPQINQNSEIKESFTRWNDFLKNCSKESFGNLDSLKRIAEFVSEETSYSAYDLTHGAIGNYQKLEDLLQQSKWNEADIETQKIIFQYTGIFQEIDVNQIPISDLRKINQLWVRYSNGKFGFSIQQKILERIVKAYRLKQGLSSDDYIYYQGDEICLEFASYVGWPKDKDRIYHVNLQSSPNLPKGYFPARVFLSQHYSSMSSLSNYSRLDDGRFIELMQCDYTITSVISSWITKWFNLQ